MFNKTLTATLFFICITAHAAPIDQLQQYPLAAQYCNNLASQINADRSQIPAAVTADRQTQFINDMYTMCLQGARQGIATLKAKQKNIQPLEEKQADTWSGQQLSHFIAGVYNQGQLYGAAAFDAEKNRVKGKDSVDDLLGDLSSGKNSK